MSDIDNNDIYGLDLLTTKTKKEDSNNVYLTNNTNDYYSDSEQSSHKSMGNSEKIFSNASEDEMEEIINEAQLKEKRIILDKLRKYETKHGIKLHKPFSMNSPLQELQFELDLVNKEANMTTTVKYMKQALVTGIYCLEKLNKRFDPLDIYLDGWTASYEEGIDSVETVLEDLYDKYFDSIGCIPPEIQLIGGIVLSGVVYNSTHRVMQDENSSMISKMAKNIDDLDGPSGDFANKILSENTKRINVKFS